MTDDLCIVCLELHCSHHSSVDSICQRAGLRAYLSRQHSTLPTFSRSPKSDSGSFKSACRNLGTIKRHITFVSACTASITPPQPIGPSASKSLTGFPPFSAIGDRLNNDWVASRSCRHSVYDPTYILVIIFFFRASCTGKSDWAYAICAIMTSGALIRSRTCEDVYLHCGRRALVHRLGILPWKAVGLSSSCTSLSPRASVFVIIICCF